VGTADAVERVLEIHLEHDPVRIISVEVLFFFFFTDSYRDRFECAVSYFKPTSPGQASGGATGQSLASQRPAAAPPSEIPNSETKDNKPKEGINFFFFFD
jgi:hypothetical protein